MRIIFKKGLIYLLLAMSSFTILGQKIRSYGPSWSPDGKHITYYSNRDGNNEIYLLTLSNRKHTRLTHNQKSDALPKFSPDGKKIVYFSGDEPTQLFSYSLSSEEETQLTFDESNHEDPNWVDNSNIVYNSDESGNFEIYTMNIETNEVKRLTFDSLRDYTASWCPDQQQFAFVRGTLGGVTSIYRMDRDGNNQVRLTDDDVKASTPNWNHDGSTIYFMKRDRKNNLYAMNLSTKATEKLTFDGGHNSQPGISPDGKKIVFASNRDTGNYEIYLLELGTMEVERLTFDSTVKK